MNDQRQQLQAAAQLEQDMLRPARHVNIDGAFELGWGGALVCMNAAGYLPGVLPGGALMRIGLGWLLFLFGALAPYCVPRLIKRYITWPRTGYVAYRHDTKSMRLGLVVGVVVALVCSIGLSCLMASQLRHSLSHQGAADAAAISASAVSHGQKVMLAGWLLLGCAALAAYWGRKAIRKRIPWPPSRETAATSDQQPLGPVSAASVRRRVKLTIGLTLFALPILIGGVVFGLIHLSVAVAHQVAIGLTNEIVLTVVLASNAALYLMGNAVSIRQYPWKWLLLVLLVLGPLGVSLLGSDTRDGLSPTMTLLRPVMLSAGLVWLISGGATLCSYIRHTPVPAPEAA